MARLHSLVLDTFNDPSKTKEHLNFLGNFGMSGFQQPNAFQMFFFLKPKASSMILRHPVIHTRPDVSWPLLTFCCLIFQSGRPDSWLQAAAYEVTSQGNLWLALHNSSFSAERFSTGEGQDCGWVHAYNKASTEQCLSPVSELQKLGEPLIYRCRNWGSEKASDILKVISDRARRRARFL